MSDDKNANTAQKTATQSSGRLRAKSEAQKKREQQEYRRKYFDYYDDIKTNIKQDW